MLVVLLVGLIVILALGVLVVGAWFVLTYNRFISLRNTKEATFGQISVAMKKRLDMISQLVDTVKSYVKFEKDIFTQVARLRSAAAAVKSADDAAALERETRALIGSLYAVMENYPDLKSSAQVQELMRAIEDVEHEIARLRYTYNNVVQEYNTMREVIPSNIVAALFGFPKFDYLEFEDAAERPNTKIY